MALIRDPDLRRQMGEQGASFAKGYGWDKIAGRIVDVYKEMVQVQNPSRL